MQKDRKILCGIIGIGWWGMKMSKYILKTGKFQIIMVYDILTDSSKYASQQLNCLVANSVEELVQNPNIECIFIFSPNNFHLEHSIMAAKSKKHIFIEKPIANTSREGIEIVKSCQDNNIMLFVGHNVKYYKIFQEMKKLIDINLIGDIIYIDCNRSRPIGLNINENSWRFYKNSCNGGPLIQLGIHLIDTVRFMVGFEFERIYSISVRSFLKTENDESFSVNINMESNLLLHLFTSYMLPESFYINVFGRNGCLFGDPLNGLYFQKKGSLKKCKISYKNNEPEIEEILDFYNFITNNIYYDNTSAEIAIDNLRIIEEIQERANKNIPVY